MYRYRLELSQKYTDHSGGSGDDESKLDDTIDILQY